MVTGLGGWGGVRQAVGRPIRGKAKLKTLPNRLIFPPIHTQTVSCTCCGYPWLCVGVFGV